MKKPWLERTVVPAKPQARVNGEPQPRHDAGKLLVYLPDGDLANLPWLRKCVGKGVPITPANHDGQKVWSLSANHMLKLAAAMSNRYGTVELRLGISRLTECSYSCQNAYPETVVACVCACGGEHHSGEGTYSDWYRHGFRLIRAGDIEVRAIDIARGQIQLPDWTPPPFRSAPPPVPPPAMPPRPPLRLVSPVAPPEPVVAPAAVTLPPHTPTPVRARQPDLDQARPHRPTAATAAAAVSTAGRPGAVVHRRQRPLVAGGMIGAMLAAGLLAWLLVPSDGVRSPGEASTSVPTQQVAEVSAPPPTPTPVLVPDAVAVPEPAPQPVSPPRRAAGCYPFQSGC